MAEVALLIPTFRRPKGLARLLDAVAALKTSASLTILIADNDSERAEGAALAEARAKVGYRWPLHVRIVPERGISQVRNALVAAMLDLPHIQYAAMLDDDQYPTKSWLEHLLSVQHETGADAVRGSVLHDFDREPPKWAQSAQGVAATRAPTGPVPMISGTGNVLVARGVLERMKAPWFDPAFGLTGGEDVDFFTRLKAQGCRFAWSDEAVAYEHVPTSRTTFMGVLRRAYGIGNSDMRVFLKYPASYSSRASEGAKIVGVLLLFPVLLVILGWFPNRRLYPLRILCRAVGKVVALCGRNYHEYATIHGE